MRLLFCAHLKEVTGRAEIQLSLGEVDSNGLWRHLLAVQPGLAPLRGNIRLARNWEFAGPNTRFGDADEVALIPPVSGG
jgi:molybdopterin converting factor small subunit